MSRGGLSCAKLGKASPIVGCARIRPVACLPIVKSERLRRASQLSHSTRILLMQPSIYPRPYINPKKYPLERGYTLLSKEYARNNGVGDLATSFCFLPFSLLIYNFFQFFLRQPLCVASFSISLVVVSHEYYCLIVISPLMCISITWLFLQLCT